jgi:hypothetical protein
MEAFLQTLEIRNDWCEEFPLHGMANEVSARHGSHEYRICVVLRAQSTDARERSADLEVTEGLREQFGAGKVFDIEIDGTNKDVILQDAARALATAEDVQEGEENLQVADF